MSPTRPVPRIARREDDTVHLAFKRVHAVDQDVGFVAAAQVYPTDAGDTATLARYWKRRERTSWPWVLLQRSKIPAILRPKRMILNAK